MVRLIEDENTNKLSKPIHADYLLRREEASVPSLSFSCSRMDHFAHLVRQSGCPLLAAVAGDFPNYCSLAFVLIDLEVKIPGPGRLPKWTTQAYYSIFDKLGRKLAMGVVIRMGWHCQVSHKRF